MSKEVVIYTMVLVLSVATVWGVLKIGVEKIARRVTAKPVFYILLCLAVVCALGIGMKNLAFEPDTKEMLPKDVPGRIVLDKIEESFGGIDTVYICVTATQGTIWDPQVMSVVRAVTEDMKSTSWADHVISLTESKAITNDDDMMVVSDMVPEDLPLSTPADIEALKARVKSNKMLYKHLVSPDEKSTLIFSTVQFRQPKPGAKGPDDTYLLSDEEICQPVKDNPAAPTLMNIMARHETPATKLTLTGFPYFRYDNQKRMERDNAIFLTTGIIVMLAFLFASFRTLRGMLLPLTIVIMGLIASFGFMGWMHEKITLPLLMMGPMLIAIAHNYGTQLIAKYYEDVQAWKGTFTRDDVKKIAGNSIISIGSPVIISAVTVIIGFLTMISHPIDALALLGVICAFGIVISFVLTLVLTPAILSLLKVPQMLMDKRHGATTDRMLEAVARFTVQRKSLLLGLVVLITMVCVVFTFKIRVEGDVMNAYPENDPVSTDAKFIGDKFGGYSTLNVLIEAKNPVAPDAEDDGPMKNPSILKWMEDFQKYAMSLKDPVSGEKLVGDALSLADYIAYMNSVMQDNPNDERVPDTRELIAQYLLSFDSQGGDSLSGLVDFKYNKAQIIVRMPDMASSRLKTVDALLKQYIREHPNPEIDVSFGGPVEIVNEINDLIVDGQVWSLALSFIIIVFCYMIFFRSPAAGLLAAVPLFCAVVLVFGTMGIFNIPLDAITATLTGISIGAGSDYTAYFLWRFRERASASGNLVTGYVEAMTTIGKGILYNGLSVVVGFFVFLFSQFMPIRYFGFLISFSIFACIVSTLTILPVIIFMTKPRFLLSLKTDKDDTAGGIGCADGIVPLGAGDSEDVKCGGIAG